MTLTILTILLSVNIALTFYLILLMLRYQKATEQEVKTLNEQVKQAPPEPPSPNQATKKEEVVVPLDEQTPWQIPNDVKVEIEGGDTLAPLGYEVTNATS